MAQQSLAKASQPKFSSFVALPNIKALIQNSVGNNAQKFTTAIISAVSNNKALAECESTSILSGALLGEALKLSPSPQLGQYYLVPFKSKVKNGNSYIEVQKAQFILGAKGYKQLAMRSGQYKDIDVIEIKQGEYKGRNKYTGKQEFEFVQDDDVRETLPTVGYLAYFELLNGFYKQIYWSKEKMLNHADKYSQAFNRKDYELLQQGKIADKDMWKFSSFWYKDFDQMAFKTIIKNLISQWGVMSIDMQTAITSDEGIINEQGEAEFVEVVEEQVQEEAPQQQEAPKVEVTEEEKQQFDFFD